MQPISTKALIKKVWSIALPITTSRLVNVIASFWGMLFVARLGHTELAASALITATQLPLFLIASSPLFAISVVAGHAFGARRFEDVGGILQQGLLLGLIVSALVLIIPLSIKPILLALGQDSALINIIQNYFMVFAFAIPGLLGSIAIQQILIAIGKQRVVLLTSIMGAMLFIIFAPLFIYGAGFIPRLGVPGLALAWALLSWINLAIYILVSATVADFKVYQLFKWQVPQTFHFMKKLFTI